MNLKLLNSSSFADGFSPAVATWNGPPNGPGNTGGECGYGDDVGKSPYNGMVFGGNFKMFKNGRGCGACYQVKCTDNPSCSGVPITVTLVDECPMSCDKDDTHFDLSGIAFGSLAKPGQADQLRAAKRINVQYQRKTSCNYGTGIKLKFTNKAFRPNHLSFTTEYVNGEAELGFLHVLPSSSGLRITMAPSIGATWSTDLFDGQKCPCSVQVTTKPSNRSIVVSNVLGSRPI